MSRLVFFLYDRKRHKRLFQNLVVFPDSYNPEKDVEFYNSIEKNKREIKKLVAESKTIEEFLKKAERLRKKREQSSLY